MVFALFATEHGIDLRRADGIFQDNLLLDHTMAHMGIFNTQMKVKRQKVKASLPPTVISNPTASLCRVDTFQGDYVMFNGQPIKDVAIKSTALIRPLAALTSTEGLEEMPSNINIAASEAVRCFRKHSIP